jgi:hypothetical protein
MFLKPRKSTTDPRLRSLLQKAARRGFKDIVRRVFHRLEKSGDRTWLRSRTVVITFEESWPLASSLAITSESSSKLDALLSVSTFSKQKDAAGLGALAYAYQQGDRSMVDGVPNPELLKIVAGALLRPAAFFEWILKQSQTEKSTKVAEAARQFLPAATWQWDKACLISGALLAIKDTIPIVEPALPPRDEFPYWVALDKHTPQGKQVLTKVAPEIQSSYRQLIWASFYCESALVNQLGSSPWWDAEKTWRLRRAGLTIASAQALWARAFPVIREALRSEADSLRQLVDDVQPDSLGHNVQDNLFGQP